MSIFGRKSKTAAEKWNIRTMYGPNLDFPKMEAYKLLRTNIMFSFPEDGVGRVIGITSSVQSEGKSSTACNTAYVLSESGAKVMLLEADLRRPTQAAKLGLARSPGVTNLLVSKEDYHEVIQHCSYSPALDVIVSGDIPPNPSELLGSARMEQLLAKLKQEYDYIVVDLPPVTVVSDTLAVSKYLDGIALVVRSCVSDRQMLSEAMRQLNMVDVRVLGFVYQDSDESKKKYSQKYSKKYYRYYQEYAKKSAKK